MDINDSGDIIAVWVDYHHLYSRGWDDWAVFHIYGQRYDADGNAIGNEFVIYTDPDSCSSQNQPSVAIDETGGFVVVWARYRCYAWLSMHSDVFGRRFDNTGAPTGPPFQVNTRFGPGPAWVENSQPQVGLQPNGDMVVVWQGEYADSSDLAVCGRRFDGDDNPIGDEFVVNTYTDLDQCHPALAVSSTGMFVVAWRSELQNRFNYDDGIFCRRYGSDGAPIGGEIRVNQVDSRYQLNPSVAINAANQFLVVWEASDPNSSSVKNPRDVYGRAFGAGGDPLYDEFIVPVSLNIYDHTYTWRDVPLLLSLASVSAGADGKFIIAYYDIGVSYDVYCQMYDLNTDQLGPAVRANTATNNNQRDPSVAANTTGRFIVAWNSDHLPYLYDACGRIYEASMVATFFQNVRAYHHGDHIKIEWSVLTDDDVAGFDIYRRVEDSQIEASITGQALLPPDASCFVDAAIQNGKTYVYTIIARSSDGSEFKSSPVSVSVPESHLRLLQNYPNPFAWTTSIRFSLPELAQVNLSIYTPEGKHVRTLINQPMPAGYKEILWDGKDSLGNQVSSGIYLYRLKTSQKSLTKKMILLR